MARHIAVPTGHQHQRSTQVNAGVHHADHAGDVEHGHHGQGHVFGRAVTPQGAGHGVVHDGGVRVHASFGQTGRATGVRQDRQVRAAGGHFRQGLALGHGVAPYVHLTLCQCRQGTNGYQPVMPVGGQILWAGQYRIEYIGELGHHQMQQLLIGRQGIAGCGQLRGEICGGDGHAGVWIRDVVLELFHPVHGIDGHDHGIEPQNGKVRDHQLRTVLHVEHNPVALMHTELGQVTGQSLGLLKQLRIRPSLPHVDQGFFVWKTLSADLQIDPQRSDGGRNGSRQPFRPKRSVSGHARNSGGMGSNGSNTDIQPMLRPSLARLGAGHVAGETCFQGIPSGAFFPQSALYFNIE